MLKRWLEANAGEVTAQLAHFAWGAYVPYKLAQHGMPLWAGALISAGIFAGKEAAESLWGVWEAKQPWKSGGIDYLFFILGILSLLL